MEGSVKMADTKINSLYTDVIDVTFNMYNVTLLIQLMEEGPTPLVLGKIKMSPQTAKSLYNMLKNNLDKYEELYSEIPVYNEEVIAKERAFNEELLRIQEEQKKIKEEM